MTLIWAVMTGPAAHKRVRSRRARPAAHSGKSNRLQVKWPKNRFTKPTPAELDKAPGKIIHFQGFMKASAPNVLQIMLYRGRGMQWTSNWWGLFQVRRVEKSVL